MSENSTPASARHLATFAGGCFWCLDAAYRQLDGVLDVKAGYMGGKTLNPAYEQVCTGETGHAEVVQITYDPARISYSSLLEWFWKLHDPTQLNRQGDDIGTQYRSAIFYHSPEQEQEAKASLAAEQSFWDTPIATIIQQAEQFWPAEDYHQDYYAHNAALNPYCTYVIKPKLDKVKLKSDPS